MTTHNNPHYSHVIVVATEAEKLTYLTRRHMEMEELGRQFGSGIPAIELSFGRSSTSVTSKSLPNSWLPGTVSVITVFAALIYLV